MKSAQHIELESQADAARDAHVRSELDRIVDGAGRDSFPASDAPAWWSAPPKVVQKRY